MTIDFQKIADAIEKAPEEIKNLMFSFEFGDKLFQITDSYDLEEEQALQIIDEVGYIMLGLKNMSSLSLSLVEIGIDKESSELIAFDIKENIFPIIDGKPMETVANDTSSQKIGLAEKQEISKKIRTAIREKSKENLPSQILNLSQIKQDMILAGVWEERTVEIAKKYSINEIQTDFLVNDTMFVLLEIEDKENLLETIVSDLKISRLLAEQIVNDLDVRVFDYISKSLQNKTKDADSRGTETRTVAENIKADTGEEMSKSQFQKPTLTVGSPTETSGYQIQNPNVKVDVKPVRTIGLDKDILLRQEENDLPEIRPEMLPELEPDILPMVEEGEGVRVMPIPKTQVSMTNKIQNTAQAGGINFRPANPIQTTSTPTEPTKKYGIVPDNLPKESEMSKSKFQMSNQDQNQNDKVDTGEKMSNVKIPISNQNQNQNVKNNTVQVPIKPITPSASGQHLQSVSGQHLDQKPFMHSFASDSRLATASEPVQRPISVPRYMGGEEGEEEIENPNDQGTSENPNSQGPMTKSTEPNPKEQGPMTNLVQNTNTTQVPIKLITPDLTTTPSASGPHLQSASGPHQTIDPYREPLD